MKKIVILVMCGFVCGAAFAQTAVIKQISGTVELKQSGAAEWVPASPGAALSADTMISTGFKSTAIIGIGNSIITVKPLTRLTLAQLRQEGQNESVNLTLQTGRIRAQVKPPAGGKTDFKVKSPVATASVRGTEFGMNTRTLDVDEGTVEYASEETASSVYVDGGGSSSYNELTRAPEDPVTQTVLSLIPDMPLGSEMGIPGTPNNSDAPAVGAVEPQFVWATPPGGS